MKKPSFLRDPKFRYGSLSTALLCVAIALLVAFNGLFTALEKKYGWRVDYSFNSITSYSEATEEVLAELQLPVHIYALYEKGDEDLLLFELLNRYAAASDLITWEQTPLSLNPTLATRFAGAMADNSVTTDSLVVFCPETERFRVLSAKDFLTLSIVDYETGTFAYDKLTYESSLTSAIAYVTQDVIPVVYMVQGHDELDENTAATLADFLRSNHYDVRFASLSDITLYPEDLLVFLAPVRDLTDSELKLITDFTGQGGSLLFACDYSDPIASMPNYRALLRSYGFVPKEGVVVASSSEKSSYFEGNRTVLLPQMQPTEITLDLLLNGTSTLILSTARAFETPDGTDNSLTVTPMLLSGEGSYLHRLSSSTSLTQQPEDEVGPFPLALEAYRFSASGDVSRAVVIGSTATLTSEYYYSMTHAQEFIIRTMEYLVDSAASNLHIMARAAVRPGLSADALTLGSLLVVAIPLSVLAAALLILSPRRHL